MKTITIGIGGGGGTLGQTAVCAAAVPFAGPAIAVTIGGGAVTFGGACPNCGSYHTSTGCPNVLQPQWPSYPAPAWPTVPAPLWPSGPAAAAPQVGTFTFTPVLPRISDDDVERIAKRVVELIKEPK